MAAVIAYKVAIFLALAVVAATSTGAMYYYQRQTILNDQVATLDQNANSLSSQIAALKAQIENLTRAITMLQTTNSQLANETGTLQTLNTQLTGDNAQLQTLQSQLTGIASQLAALNAQLSDKIAQLQLEITDLQFQVNQLKTLVSQLNQTRIIISLTGAGSAFAFNLLSAMDENFTGANPGIQINYVAIGSGAGVVDLSTKTVEFAASDAPLSPVQMLQVPGALTIPETIGGVAIAYNLPGVPKGLLLNVTVAARIFQGNITMWNDPEILQLNPSMTLPASQITVVHRSDSSQATFELSDYLNSSSAWKLGVSKALPWPTGLGANSDVGVASVIQGTRYTIGYVGVDKILSTSGLSPPITYAYLYNPSSASFIEPTLASVDAAAASLNSLPAGNGNWQQVSLINSNSPAAYPIAYLSFLIVYQELNVYGPHMTQTVAQALVNYLWFVVHDGQNQATPNFYSPLTPSLVTVDEATIRSMTYNGQSLHT